MSQTIQVNPEKLSTYLAKCELDRMYHAGEILYPYIDSGEDDIPSIYTPNAQDVFDHQYEWFYGVITAHDINKSLK